MIADAAPVAPADARGGRRRARRGHDIGGFCGRSSRLDIGRRTPGRTAGLFIAAALLMLLRQVSWLDREPIGFWPRVALRLGAARLGPGAAPRVPRRPSGPSPEASCWRPCSSPGSASTSPAGGSSGINARSIASARSSLSGIYLSAMPTYRGLELAHERHHFRTIINLFPEHTPEGSPLLPDELRFAREHGINYLGNDPDDPTGEAFVARTLELARDPSAWPILVHCHASMDRSPAWVGLYRFVVQGWPLADALREIERHRGLRPKASVTLLYNRMLPKLAPDRAAQDPDRPRCCERTRPGPWIP